MKKLLAALVLWLIAHGSAFGAVAYDNASSAAGVGVSTLTISSFAVAATTPLVVCAIAADYSPYAAPTITYAGVNMNHLGTTLTQSTNNLDVFYLAGQSGTNNAAMSFPAATTIIFGCMSFTGVDQSTPLGTSQQSSDYQGAPISLTVPTNGLSFDFAVAAKNSTGCGDLVPGGSQIERTPAPPNDCANAGGGASFELSGSTRATTGNLSWTFVLDEYAFQIGAPINAAAVGGGVARRRIVVMP
jgi:hypothetical protein